MTDQPAAANDAFAADALTLIKPVKDLHARSARLNLFNKAAAVFPVAVVSVPLVFFPEQFINPGFLLGAAALSAATTQVSRWLKSGIRKDFEKLWQGADPQTRPLLLGHTREMLEKISPRTEIISRDDFNLKNAHALIPLIGTGFVAAVHLPLAPLAFFGGAQLREVGESARLEIATRHNLAYLNHIKPD